MMEAVEFVHAEGWDAAPTLFALVPTALVADQLAGLEDEAAPLTLIVQEDIPEHIQPGSDELGDYLTRLAWPEEIAGVILAQEIMFKDTAEAEQQARPARLFSGVLREEGLELTLLQIRPTEEELEAAGPFAQDEIQLRGGPGVAPAVIGALRYSLDNE
ncbi:PPA1309 family protein [Corynebacterium meitnerae]|uniref:PPA1309 family protein n=1 Tax=Corynebacterium meitnerae TaxID=2913498 RepID=A0A9X3LT08_9CORY|nr:PPA1309 family protein [Corynebacterium meitnerae]MCZ9293604.1 PPA1309 family protein [Corynebacterium meitnerae]